MLDFRERTIAADDGAQLHGWIHDGTTPPVVLLHDLDGDAHYWEPMLTALLGRNPGVAVASLDLRGHGGSELGTETSRKRMVKDLRRWVKELEIDPPIVIGHGYGADIAMAADFVDSVIAVNPAFGRLPDPIPPELTTPAGMRGAIDAAALRTCTVGCTQAKELKRGRRDAPLLLSLSDPADLGVPAVSAHRELAEDVQLWRSASRHLPLEFPAGMAALVLGWIEEVA